MTLQVSQQTQALIQQQLATGRYATEDDLLREALAALSAADEDWVAIQEGLQSLDRPETWIPLEVADAEIRNRLRIPAP
jgi:Arc/MetJ-type ribon-helix-helix transcriptional regulator